MKLRLTKFTTYVMWNVWKYLEQLNGFKTAPFRQLATLLQHSTPNSISPGFNESRNIFLSRKSKLLSCQTRSPETKARLCVVFVFPVVAMRRAMSPLSTAVRCSQNEHSHRNRTRKKHNILEQRFSFCVLFKRSIYF